MSAGRAAARQRTAGENLVPKPTRQAKEIRARYGKHQPSPIDIDSFRAMIKNNFQLLSIPNTSVNIIRQSRWYLGITVT